VGLMLSGNAATVELRGAPGAVPASQRIDPMGGAPWTSAPLEVAGGVLEVTIRPSGGPVLACYAAVIPDGNRP